MGREPQQGSLLTLWERATSLIQLCSLISTLYRGEKYLFFVNVFTLHHRTQTNF